MTKSYYRTTILIDRELWKKFRIRAMNKNKSASQLLEDIIEEEISKR